MGKWLAHMDEVMSFSWANSPSMDMPFSEKAQGLRASPNGYPAIVYQIDDINIECFRKTTNPRRGGYQGWERTTVADTLNLFDNSESRTPIVICIEGNGSRPSHRGGGVERRRDNVLSEYSRETRDML